MENIGNCLLELGDSKPLSELSFQFFFMINYFFAIFHRAIPIRTVKKINEGERRIACIDTLEIAVSPE
jgi:hypothetical protein